MISDFIENLTNVGKSTLDGISPDRRNVKIRFALKNRTKGPSFTLTNVFYLPNSPSNFVSLGLLNNAGIYYHNKDQTLYKLET